MILTRPSHFPRSPLGPGPSSGPHAAPLRQTDHRPTLWCRRRILASLADQVRPRGSTRNVPALIASSTPSEALAAPMDPDSTRKVSTSPTASRSTALESSHSKGCVWGAEWSDWGRHGGRSASGHVFRRAPAGPVRAGGLWAIDRLVRRSLSARLPPGGGPDGSGRGGPSRREKPAPCSGGRGECVKI